ncbi:Ubiquitin carboxyl-terminal hydrolase isozyme L5, partial [Fragariocoptes setiger]
MSAADDWCLIESDPGVFTELIRGFGVKNVVVEELYSLDPTNFENLHPIYGLIFLFKWQRADDSQANIVRDSRLERMFFAQQVINNACATQAIISVLLNAKTKPPGAADTDDLEAIELGETLTSFKEFSRDFDPNMKGLALSNSGTIRIVHNTFARQQLIEYDPTSKSKNEDVFHFISYVPFEGRLYELDGLREGPIDLGAIPEKTDWVTVARPVIEKRMQQYSQEEIQFNLMAVVADKRPLYRRKLAELEQQLTSGMETDTIEMQMAELRQMLAAQEAKMKAYRVENIRRKHNYLPLIMQVLCGLAKEGKLSPLVTKASEKALEEMKREKERKRKKNSTD